MEITRYCMGPAGFQAPITVTGTSASLLALMTTGGSNIAAKAINPQTIYTVAIVPDGAMTPADQMCFSYGGVKTDDEPTSPVTAVTNAYTKWPYQGMSVAMRGADIINMLCIRSGNNNITATAIIAPGQTESLMNRR